MATKIYTFNLKGLVSFIERNHVAVPEFQRGFVWRTKQVKELFDSLIKKYPIGSFILWKTRQKLDARTLDGETLPKEKFFVLDGQQRMTSLYYLNKPLKFLSVKDSFHQICESKERHLIDFEKFLIVNGSKGPELGYLKSDSKNEFDPKRFRSLVGAGYKFPIVVISLDTYAQAITVFERINQAGTRISTESIFLSETWTKHTNFGKILRVWKSKDKSKNALTREIDTVIFIHVFALIFQLENRKNGGKIEIGITALKKIAEIVRKESGDKYNHLFKDVVTAVAEAVQYLTTQYGIVHIGNLPSQTMITVLAVFFYYQPRALSLRQSKELRKWFWRSSLGNRYIGSGYSENIGVDTRKMKNLAEKNLKLNLPFVSSKIFAKLKEVDIKTGRSTYRNIVKQALWQQEPYFINGVAVERTDVESRKHEPEDDHFFPFNLMKRGIAGQEINNILNIHFLEKVENIRKGKRRPSEWLEEEVKKTGASPRDVARYFKSELLPFETLRELKKYDNFFDLKGRARQKEFARRYKRFLLKRYKKFEKVFTRLQNGHLK